MIEQLSNAIKFLAFFTSSKVGKTGLTVTVDVYNPAGTQVVTAGSATAIGEGLYAYTLSSVSVGAEGEYIAIFKTTDTTVDQQHIPSLWVVGRGGVEHLDLNISAVQGNVWEEAFIDHDAVGTLGQKLNAAGSAADPLLNTVPGTYASGTAGNALGRIGTGAITVISPVALSGDITLISGDDYAAVDGRAIEWISADWPDLTGATIAFNTKTVVDTGAFTKAGVVVTPTGTKRVRVEFTNVETAAFNTSAPYKFDIQATLASGRIVTLVRSHMLVKEDYS